ncbi:hypothetical protein CCYA_CCYA02G0656 [Cyanidiococcus yangmingshanensis]|nr:hypothetical protein CCYA_CCYA02G0656 [Cyanidiococcus yangmingshanensis]
MKVDTSARAESRDRLSTVEEKGWFQRWQPRALFAVLATPSQTVTQPTGTSAHSLRVLADIQNLPSKTSLAATVSTKEILVEDWQTGKEDALATTDPVERTTKHTPRGGSHKQARRTRRTIGTSPLLVRPLREPSTSISAASPTTCWSEREEAYLMEIAFLRERVTQLEIMYRERREQLRRMERSFPLRCRAIAYEAAVATQRMLQRQRLRHRAEIRSLRTALSARDRTQTSQEGANSTEMQATEVERTSSPTARQRGVQTPDQ